MSNPPFPLTAQPPPINPDSFQTYNHVYLICKPVDRIAESIDPYELAQNPAIKPSTNIAQDLTYATNSLFEVQKSLYTSFNPTQMNLFSTYHNLLLAIARFLANQETIIQPTALRNRFPPPRLQLPPVEQKQDEEYDFH